MPAKSDAPLRKVTLNLYESDCAAMEHHYGYGWTETVRQLLHGHISQISRPAQILDQPYEAQNKRMTLAEWCQLERTKRTIGDLSND